MNKEDKTVLCECANCSWRGDVSDCNEIHDLLDRVEVGEEFPAGECPECGALTYLLRQYNDKDKNNSEKIPRVIISVSGGVAELLLKPVGIAVMLVDYDVDGVEEVSVDPDGARCIINHCHLTSRIVSNDHWPVVKQSLRDITNCCSRRWQCPSCNKTIDCSYEQIVEIGTPHCPHCEIEMIMA